MRQLLMIAAVVAAVAPPLVAQTLPTEITYTLPAQANHTWETRAEGLFPANGFAVHEGAAYLGLGSELYRVDDDGVGFVARGLPDRVKLLSTPHGLIGWTTTGIYAVGGTEVAPLWEGADTLRGVLYAEGALWGLEGVETQRLWRRSLSADLTLGSDEEVLGGITDGYAVFADAEGVFYSTGGDEPRLIFEVSGGAATQVSTSRFWAAEMVRVDADHLAVLGGSSSGGWIEVLELSTGAWERLGYAPRGSTHLILIDDVLYWRSPSAVFRLRVDGVGAPEAVVVGMQPAGLGFDGTWLQWVDAWSGEVARQAP